MALVFVTRDRSMLIYQGRGWVNVISQPEISCFLIESVDLQKNPKPVVISNQSPFAKHGRHSIAKAQLLRAATLQLGDSDSPAAHGISDLLVCIFLHGHLFQ